MLGEILAEADPDSVPGSLVALGVPVRRHRGHTTRYKLSTSKGAAAIEFKRTAVSNGDLLQCLDRVSLEVQHSDANSVAIGTFRLNRDGDYREYELKEGLIYVDVAGLDSDSTCLVFCKRRHRAFYNIARPVPIGRVVSGSKVFYDLDITDRIEDFAPQAPADASTSLSFRRTTNLKTRISDGGTVVYSRVEAKLNGAAPRCADFLLKAVEGNVLNVAISSGSFMSVEGVRGVEIPERNPSERTRGCISIRNSGKEKGRFYFFKKTRPKAESHTVIGEITRGIVLVDLARSGDFLSVKINERIVNTIGMTQREAGRLLDSIGVVQERSGNTLDESIVVRQDPSTTLEIMSRGCVETIGLNKEMIAGIQLNEREAPHSVEFFRVATGLKSSLIGSLRVEYPYSRLVGAILLKADLSTVELPNLGPENVPTKLVRRGDIGITNFVKTRMGSIGIRVDPSREFGPTCESLESTNIIGRIVGESLDIILEADPGSDVFLTEAEKNPQSFAMSRRDS